MCTFGEGCFSSENRVKKIWFVIILNLNMILIHNLLPYVVGSLLRCSLCTTSFSWVWDGLTTFFFKVFVAQYIQRQRLPTAFVRCSILLGDSFLWLVGFLTLMGYVARKRGQYLASDPQCNNPQRLKSAVNHVLWLKSGFFPRRNWDDCRQLTPHLQLVRDLETGNTAKLSWFSNQQTL